MYVQGHHFLEGHGESGREARPGRQSQRHVGSSAACLDGVSLPAFDMLRQGGLDQKGCSTANHTMEKSRIKSTSFCSSQVKALEEAGRSHAAGVRSEERE